MNILFDLVHPADVNLFKNSIFQLKKQGYNVILTLRERGVLKKIAEKEFPEFDINTIGTHKKGFLKKVFSIIKREFRFYKFLKNNNIKVAICQGVTFGMACKILKIPLIHHDDDHEYWLTYMLGKYFSSADIMPEFMPVSGSNFIKYKGFKELAYIHPQYFKPNINSINVYSLIPFKYVLIREISNISINYQDKSSFLNEILTHLNKKGFTVLLSIENKSNLEQFKNFAIVLDEPVEDLYSLIYYSCFMISSGDTMARESSLIGVPCIYTGGRSMSANEILIKKGILYKKDKLSEIIEQIDSLSDFHIGMDERDKMHKFVTSNYDDVNQVFLDQILNFI